MVEKVECVKLIVNKYLKGQGTPQVLEINSPYVIVAYSKNGGDQLMLSGSSLTRSVGILKYLYQNTELKEEYAQDIEKVVIGADILIYGNPKPQHQAIECDLALIIYSHNFTPTAYYAGMDLFQAVGTIEYVQMQTIVGNTLKAMMTGLSTPRGTAPILRPH